MLESSGTRNLQGRIKRPLLGVRRRLMILAVFAIMPLAIGRVYDIEIERRDNIEEARRHALVLAQQGAAKQNEAIAAARGTLQLIARAYPKFVESAVSCDDFIRAAVVGTPGVKTVSVSRPDGKIVCSANPGSIGLDISDRTHFQDVMRDGGFALSDYALGRRILGPTVFVSYGERTSAGKVDAVFTALLDLDWIGRVAADIAKRAGSVVLMVDSAGTILTRYPNPDQWMGKQFNDYPLVKQMLLRPEGVITEKGIDGISRIFGFTKLPGVNAHFAIGLDESTALQTVNSAMLRSYGQLTVVTALVLIGIWFGGERFFMRPIRSLAHTATQIGRGQLTARAMHEALAEEFVPLAAAMDKMAAQLAAREDELRATNEKLEKLAQRDGLTGLANRRTLDARLQDAWQDSAHRRRPLALLMIDIDNFKPFNDSYGHLEGDACLRSVADVLSKSARKDDELVARYGGEEFAVLLPGATLSNAMEAAERLRAAVEELEIVNITVPPGYVTVSIGVASLTVGGSEDAENLIKAADSALYVAKYRGRNKVVAHAPVVLPMTG